MESRTRRAPLEMAESDSLTPRESARVAVVAAGIVSPLGFGLDETRESLQTGRDCVTPVTRFSVEQTRCKTAGQIPDGPLISQGQISGTQSACTA